MGFKRKRSCSNASPTSSVSSFASATSRGSQSPTPSRSTNDTSMDFDRPIPIAPFAAWASHQARLSSSDLNSRTRKRFRDNRPDEEIIHEFTLSKLFSAQKRNPDASPILSHLCQSSRQTIATQRSTLHAFWSLPKPNVPPLSAVTYASQANELDSQCCDDCERTLNLEDTMDLDIMDQSADNAFTCRVCRKRVCDTCAVVSDERRCLECSTTRNMLRELSEYTSSTLRLR